ncbi:MAG TPA: hypothetical protein VGC42_25370, partial [Kofleriaceae bacterium]
MGGFEGKDRTGPQTGAGPGVSTAAAAGNGSANAVGTRPLVPAIPVGPVASAGGRSAAAPPDGAADAARLDAQAALRGPEAEIPALEGALLSTRVAAVERGLLSHSAFDAGLALSRAMTMLQPAVAANAPVDGLQRELAANAARQLIAALEAEAGGEHNFHMAAQIAGSGVVNTRNPYTGELRGTSYLLWSRQVMTSNWRASLPDAIHAGRWRDAFGMYRDMLDGLDRWVADQLRKQGPGTPEAASGDAHEHNAALRTGLE